jgi:hypothetical protein
MWEAIDWSLWINCERSPTSAFGLLVSVNILLATVAVREVRIPSLQALLAIRQRWFVWDLKIDWWKSDMK